MKMDRKMFIDSLIKNKYLILICVVIVLGTFFGVSMLKFLPNEFEKMVKILNPGDEVILPSYTFSSTATSAVLAGAKLVFVDVRPDTMNIDETKIEAAITKRTKAIVVVHLYGMVADMDPIMKIAKKYKLAVVEDCAQCFGGKYKGKKAGTLGTVSCFSFCQSKHFTTGGEGGITERLLDGLKARNARATFFLCGYRVEEFNTI